MLSLLPSLRNSLISFQSLMSNLLPSLQNSLISFHWPAQTFDLIRYKKEELNFHKAFLYVLMYISGIKHTERKFKEGYIFFRLSNDYFINKKLASLRKTSHWSSRPFCVHISFQLFNFSICTLSIWNMLNIIPTQALKSN